MATITKPSETIWYSDATAGYIRAPACCGITTVTPMRAQLPGVDNISWRHNQARTSHSWTAT